MDLIFINQTFGLGGAENFNLALIKYLKSQGHRVLPFLNYSPFIGLLNNQNIHAQKVPFDADIIGDWKGLVKAVIFGPLLFGYYLYIIFSHPNVHTYYFTGFIEKILCIPILKILGKKVVWIEFGPLQPVFAKWWHLPEYLYRYAALFSQTVIFSSRNSLHLNQKYFPKKSRLMVIPLGSPIPPKTKPVTSFDVLCLSRLEPGKGQDLLTAAWVKVLTKVPQARLIIVGVGDQPYTEYLKNMAPPNVVFAGRVPNQYAYYAACKFTVFPSVWPLEGFGLVITESLSMGKPVVAFDRAPGNEIIKSGFNGLLGDDLAENILKLLKNPKLLTKLSQQAKLDFDQHYREDIYLSAYAHTLLS